VHSFNRGGPVAAWDEQARVTIAELGEEIDHDGALAVWETALAAKWNGSDVWVHGDITGSNLIMRDDRLCGVIDFGCAAVGDPACDLTAAWTMFEGTSRQRFQSTVRVDAGTWARARRWALWKALIDIPGTTSGRSRTHGSEIRMEMGRTRSRRPSDRRLPLVALTRPERRVRTTRKPTS
jgi:aminoglycoside phosphotransferase (APT) family kinase protein